MKKSFQEEVETKSISSNFSEISLNQNKSLGSKIGLLLGRSLFPLTAILIIMGTIVWGPWISLILAIVWFSIVLVWIG